MHNQYWDIDRALSRYVQNPKKLRSLLAKTEALISGSFAVQFLERVEWEGSDLDIFIGSRSVAKDHETPDASILFSFLMEEGYKKMKPKFGIQDYSSPLIVSVDTFVRYGMGGSEKKVQVIITDRLSVQGIITQFWSTTVVNIISWNKAYAIFAKPTFLDHAIYPTNMHKCIDWNHDGCKNHDALIEKYEQRGYHLVADADCNDRSTPFNRPRLVSDASTWTIPFDVTDVEPSSIPATVLEHSAFDFRTSSSQSASDPSPQPRHTWQLITANEFNHCTLRYTYTAGGCYWPGYLAEHLDEQFAFQMGKVSPEKAHAYLTCLLRHHGPMSQGHNTWEIWEDIGFEEPAGWVYEDERLGEAWEKFLKRFLSVRSDPESPARPAIRVSPYRIIHL
ncbi:MAG: hypothetical protein Q9227_001138 [Pyrenula ochraceoflavens]